MTFALVFWILMLFWLIFGIGYRNYMFNQSAGPWGYGGDLLLFVLILLLGWHEFGAPIHG